MRVPERSTAWASTRVPGPSTTPASITAKAPIWTPAPSSAPGAIRADGWTSASVTRSRLAVDDGGEQLALGAEGAVDARLAAELPHVGAVVQHRDVEIEPIAGG